MGDEGQARAALHRAVLALGYEVEGAAGGPEALRRLARQSYDVVLCDLLLSTMIGDELLRTSHEEHPGIASRFVFLDGCPGGLTSIYFAASGGPPCLGQPCRLAEIQAALDQMPDLALPPEIVTISVPNTPRLLMHHSRPRRSEAAAPARVVEQIA